MGSQDLDYSPCRYGASRVTFRGPRRDLSRPHALFFGGTSVYGKFLRDPLPDLVGQRSGLRCVNLGVVNAGVDLYLKDQALLDMTARARVTVLGDVSLQNMSNRFYSVHPRRNDRFLSATPLLRTIFRDVDFTPFHFTGHLLQRLHSLSPVRFADIQAELKETWGARMRTLISRISGPVILHRIAPRVAKGSSAEASIVRVDDLLTADAAMFAALRPLVVDVIMTSPADAALARDAEGLVFSQLETSAAQSQFGAPVYEEAAADLAPILRRFAPLPHSVKTGPP